MECKKGADEMAAPFLYWEIPTPRRIRCGLEHQPCGLKITLVQLSFLSRKVL